MSFVKKLDLKISYLCIKYKINMITDVDQNVELSNNNSDFFKSNLFLSNNM